MRVRWSAHEVLVDVAFPVRYDRNAVRRRHNLAGTRRRVEPALRLFICRRARAPWRHRTLVPVPYLGIDETDQRTGPNLER
jgi:hypothetical protein